MPITVSHVRGATSTSLIETTIGAAFDAATERLAEREALIVRHQNIRWTYAEFRRQVDEFAAGLVALGLQPGERVGIWSTNNAEWVVTQFATAKAGLILVNINPGYRIGELEYALNKVECAGLICAAAFRTSDYVAMLSDLMPEIATSTPGQLRAARAPSLRWLICIGADAPGFVRFDKVAACAEPSHRIELAARAATQKNTDAINVQFTSGTTGSPKGATLSHRNILNNAYFVGQRMGAGEGDRFCIQVPLYHCGGMVVGTLLCVVHGATMVFPSEWFDPLARGNCHRALRHRRRRAHHVPRHAQPPRILPLRPHLAPNRLGWRRALPGRDDAPLPRGDAPTRPHNHFRHDRDEPGLPADRAERPVRAQVWQRRQYPPPRRGEGR